MNQNHMYIMKFGKKKFNKKDKELNSTNYKKKCSSKQVVISVCQGGKVMVNKNMMEVCHLNQKNNLKKKIMNSKII